jgi:hypothetical protein
MKCKWLLLALTLSLFLLNFTGCYSVQAIAPISQSYTDSGSSITWTITEPQNQTYTTPNLNLSVTGETFMATLTNISYSIDSKQRVFLHMTYEKTDDDPITQVRRGYAQLPPLSDGVHKITVYLDGWAGFPSKPIPTQKTVINVGINTATPVHHNFIQGNGARLYSPLNQSYQPNKAILIQASSSSLGGANIIYSGTYTIDDGSPLKLKTEPQLSPDSFFGGLIGTCVLPSGSLSEGQHKLTVYLKTYIETTAKPPTMAGEATVYFSVGDTEPPHITLNGINNATFNQTSIPLTFNANEATSWVSYCLDNGTQTTITGNTTLTVTLGNHTIIMYANDTKGNLGQSETAHFSVLMPEGLDLQPSGAGILVAVVLAVVVAGGILVFCLRKRSGVKQ